jgi:hypothetical protein
LGHPSDNQLDHGRHTLLNLTRLGAGLALFTIACGAEPDTRDLTSADVGGSGSPMAPANAQPSAAGNASSTTAGARAAAGASAGKSAAGSASVPVAGQGSGTASGTTVSAGASAAAGGSAAAAAGSSSTSNEHFSFFVASYAAMQRLSGTPNGFGGDLRFPPGTGDGLSGADEICRQIAETSLPGAGSKSWRAFLSATQGSDGKPINAIDRVGVGPWYDRVGRLVALTKVDLGQPRPDGADAAILNDLPNEDGVPNHAPDGSMQVDNHDVLTGSDGTGKLYGSDGSSTCHDWTSAVGADGKPRVGHSWPRSDGGGKGAGRGPSGAAGSGMMGADGMNNWMSALDEAGCGAGASLVEMGPPDSKNPTVGSGGGYGAIYCLALTP